MIDGDCRVPLQSGGFEGGSELRKAREIYERTQAVQSVHEVQSLLVHEESQA